jgi:hypothetical protein
LNLSSILELGDIKTIRRDSFLSKYLYANVLLSVSYKSAFMAVKNFNGKWYYLCKLEGETFELMSVDEQVQINPLDYLINKGFEPLCSASEHGAFSLFRVFTIEGSPVCAYGAVIEEDGRPCLSVALIYGKEAPDIADSLIKLYSQYISF